MSRLSNIDILKRYEAKLVRAERRLERSLHGILRATNVMVRAKNLVSYLERQRRLVLEASEAGLPFRKEREKRPKPGRRIEL